MPALRMDAALMAPLTLPRAGETIRILTALLSATLLGGCATPGPLHLYSANSAQQTIISDTGPTAVVNVPSFLGAVEYLAGIAYDPFTDHLFLRIGSGNTIRVIDRPAGKVKREFVVAEAPTTGGGDMAVRPRDGHLFLTHPTEPALIEATRLGKFVRQLLLDSLTGQATGVAYDTKNDQLLVLSGSAPSVVTTHNLAGKFLSRLTLPFDGAPASLAYDSATGEFFVSGSDATFISVFDRQGSLLRQVPAPGNTAAPFMDVGERSFVRIF